MMMIKLLFATLVCLAHGQGLKTSGVAITPSASPLPFPLAERYTPSPTPNMKYSMAPTAAVGKSLGKCGHESPAFRKRCKKCCRQTKKHWKKTFRILRKCDRCKLKKNLNPGNSGPCPENAALGWTRNPTYCFYDRCHKMLAAKGPCMCF